MIDALKVFLLFLLFLQSSVVKANPTEASFNSVCSHCDSKDPKFESIKQNQQCLELLSQEACQSIPKEERKTCNKDDHLQLNDTASIIYKCLETTLLSYKFIFDFLWHIMLSAKSMLFDETDATHVAESSSKSYLFTEFYRAYRYAEGSRIERLLKAASAVGGHYFDLFWSSLQKVIENELVEFKCYKASSQVSLACSFLLGFVVPGSGVAMLLKQGVKTGVKGFKLTKNMLKSSNKEGLQNFLGQVSIKTLDADFKSVMKTLKEQKIRRADRKQIKLFLNQVDKKRLLSQIRASLNQKRKKGVNINRRQIRATALTVMTAGIALSAIKISPKTAATVSEAFANELAVRYVENEIISTEGETEGETEEE